MKKFLLGIVSLILIYFVIAGILTGTEICPKYINVMGEPVGDGLENVEGPNDPRAWHLFCPFAEKVY